MPDVTYGQGSLSQRQSGRHAGRWDFRLTVDGRRRTATWRREPTRRQIAKVISDWSSSQRPSEGESVESFLRRWLRDGLPEARPRTVHRYRVLVELHVAPTLGDVALSDLSAPEIQRWVNGLKATQRHSLMCLRAALSQAVRWGLIPANPAQHVRAPKVERKQPRILTAEQTQKLLEQVKGDPLEALWLIAAYTGMRQGEILGLRWRDLDLASSTLTVAMSLWWRPGKQGREPVLTQPKTQRSRRTIALHPKVVEALTEHRKTQMQAKRDVDDGLVFTRPDGIALEPSSVYRALHRHLAAAGLPEITFHQLRHGTASMLLASGWDLQSVSDLLGHATPYVTLSIYSHTIEKQREKTAERMGELLAG